MKRRYRISMLVAGLFFLLTAFVPARADEKKEEAAQLAEELAREAQLKQQERKAAVELHLKEGIGHYKNRRYSEALKEFDVILEIDPLCKRAKAYRGKSLRKLGEPPVNYYKEGIKLYRAGEYEEAKEQFAKILPDSRKYAKARAYINRIEKPVKKKARVVKPKKARQAAKELAREKDILYARARASYRKGDYEDAIEQFKTLTAKEPGNEEFVAWLDLAQRGLLKREAEQARTDTGADTKVVALQKDAQERSMLLDVEKAYLPPRRREMVEEAVEEELAGEEETERKRKELINRLNKIIVPAISFTDADIRVVIRELMTMTGVTMVLDEMALSRMVTGVVPAAEEEEEEFESTEDLGEGGEAGVAVPREWAVPRERVVAAPPSGRTTPPLRVTFMTVSPIPLLDLLTVALRATGLDYKVEPSYIWISDPQTLKKEELVTRTYKLKYGVRKIHKVELKEFKPED